MFSSDGWLPPTRLSVKLARHLRFVPIALYLCWVPAGLRQGWFSIPESWGLGMGASLRWEWALHFFFNLLPHFGRFLTISTVWVLGIPTSCFVAHLCARNISGANKIVGIFSSSLASKALEVRSSSFLRTTLSLSSIGGSSECTITSPGKTLGLLLRFSLIVASRMVNFFGFQIDEHRPRPVYRSKILFEGISGTIYKYVTWNHVTNGLNVFSDILLELFFGGPSCIRGKSPLLRFG